ncbi:MAG: hypothetical protein AAB548_01910 [Patescibacteria group bacterium]
MPSLNRIEDLDRQRAEILVNTLDGVLTIASHPFASPLDNEQLLKFALRLGLPEEDIEAARLAIAATGFTCRHHFYQLGTETDLPDALERTAKIGAILLRAAMAKHGWDDIDVFYDTSAFLPPEINRMVLMRAGLDPDRILTRSYRYACAGAVGALVDILSADNLRDARVAIGALEPLSLLIDQSQFVTPGNLAIPSIFTDDNAVILIEPKRILLHHKKIRVQPDGGVIKLRTLYDHTLSSQEQLPIPTHYDFRNGGETIFSYGALGAFLDIQPPDHSSLSMDGIGTGLFFGDQTSELILEILSELGDPDYLRRLNGRNLIMHPASEPVVNRIAKKLNRAGVLDSRSLPFIMGEIGRSNSSSATTLISWQNQIRMGLVQPNAPFFLVAPGVGSAIVAAAGEFC